MASTSLFKLSIILLICGVIYIAWNVLNKKYNVYNKKYRVSIMSTPNNLNNSQNNKLKNLHEMVFVYNAVMDGWVVRKLRNGKIRLKKKTKNDNGSSIFHDENYVSESEQLHLQQYDVKLEEFVRDNIQVERIFDNDR